MYKILQADTMKELVASVNQEMSRNWEPIGAPQVVQYYGQYIFFQALTKLDSAWYGKALNEQK